MEQILTTLVFIGGLAGLPIAIYFTLSFYLGDRSAFLIRFAKACNTEHGTCPLAIRTPCTRVQPPTSVFASSTASCDAAVMASRIDQRFGWIPAKDQNIS